MKVLREVRGWNSGVFKPRKIEQHYFTPELAHCLKQFPKWGQAMFAKGWELIFERFQGCTIVDVRA